MIDKAHKKKWKEKKTYWKREWEGKKRFQNSKMREEKWKKVVLGNEMEKRFGREESIDGFGNGI